jgi:Ca2+-binding EF-hand superfamily protein
MGLCRRACSLEVLKKVCKHTLPWSPVFPLLNSFDGQKLYNFATCRSKLSCSTSNNSNNNILKHRQLEASRLFNLFTKSDKIDHNSFKSILFALGQNITQQESAQLADSYKEGLDFTTFMKYCDENVSETNYSTEEIQKVFELFDRDGSGEIDSRELASVLNTFGSLLTEDDAKGLIKVADRDNNGKISFKEFCLLIKDGLVGWRLRTGYRVIFLIGGPGSGKGTLYQEISQRINSAHVSIGDLLRREMEFKTPLGVHVEEVMRDGKLVDSAIIIRLLRDTLQKLPGKHVFVDGFPRSVQNAIDFYAVCGVPEVSNFF